jgi:carboxymethylenebutenolidase
MIFGKQVHGSFMLVSQSLISSDKDTHVPRAGRDVIRSTLEDANVPVSVINVHIYLRVERADAPSQFLEVQAQHAFIRDESSKGRWDAALTRSLFAFMLEVFERTVGRDLGPRLDLNQEPEHVC